MVFRKERGNKNDLEFLNTFSFNENYLKELNGHINELVMTLYKNKDYDKLAYLLDEYHREDNFLEGAVLCDLILSSFKDDDLTMLKTLLMADYANNWNDLHIQKAWEIVIDNVTSNKTSILSSLKRKEEREERVIYYWDNLHENIKDFFFLNVVYNLLYAFSLCQIRYNKIIQYYDKTKINKTKINKSSLTLLDENGFIITNINLDDPRNPEWEYSAIILSDEINKVFYDTFPVDMIYTISKTHFINVELEYNDEIYCIFFEKDVK